MLSTLHEPSTYQVLAQTISVLNSQKHYLVSLFYRGGKTEAQRGQWQSLDVPPGLLTPKPVSSPAPSLSVCPGPQWSALLFQKAKEHEFGPR